MRKFQYRYRLLLMAVASIFALNGCAANGTQQEISVRTVMADYEEIQAVIDIAGVLVPRNTENISTKMTGTVKEINAEVGQEVNAGDILIALDTKELDAQLKQAQAAYNVAKDQAAIAKSNLEASEVGVDTAQSSLNATEASVNDQINQAKMNLDAALEVLNVTKEQNAAQLDLARQNIETAQQNFDRTEKLYNANVAAQADIDSAQNLLDIANNQFSLAQSAAQAAELAAQSKYDSAKSAYEQAYGSGANAQIVAAQNNVTGAQSKVDTAKKQYEVNSSSSLAQAQAAVNNIEVQLSNAVISAGINGVVVNKNINKGELAAAGATLITIADDTTLVLKGTIAQESLPYMKTGQSVDVNVDIYPGKAFTGTVTSVGPMSVSTGSYFPVEISVDNTDAGLMAGVSAHASIAITDNEQITVPNTAVVTNSGHTYVFVIENGLAVKRDVVLGLKNERKTEILRGLEKGDEVAVSNVNTLFDNMPVQVQAEESKD